MTDAPPTVEQVALAAHVAARCQTYAYAGPSGWDRARAEFGERDDAVLIVSMAATDSGMAVRAQTGDYTHVILCQRLPMIADTQALALIPDTYPPAAVSALTRAIQMVNAVWAEDDASMRGHYAALADAEPAIRAGVAMQVALVLSSVYYDLAHHNGHRALTTMENLT